MTTSETNCPQGCLSSLCWLILLQCDKKALGSRACQRAEGNPGNAVTPQTQVRFWSCAAYLTGHCLVNGRIASRALEPDVCNLGLRPHMKTTIIIWDLGRFCLQMHAPGSSMYRHACQVGACADNFQVSADGLHVWCCCYLEGRGSADATMQQLLDQYISMHLSCHVTTALYLSACAGDK